MKARAAIGGGKYAVAVAPRLTAACAARPRPLLRTKLFQQRIIQPADVQIAVCCQAAVFIEYGFRIGKTEQTLRA